MEIAEKASWSGIMKIKDVEIKIKLYKIIEKREKTMLLCKQHLLPIKTKKFCKNGEMLKKEDIVRAIKKDNEIIIEEKEKEKKEHVLEIENFSKQQPIFISGTYLIMADDASRVDFEKIKRLMIKKGIYGYGSLYMHNKKELVCIKAMQDYLILYVIYGKPEEEKEIEENKNIEKIIMALMK
jgi:non-homologous end joining protein Ku